MWAEDILKLHFRASPQESLCHSEDLASRQVLGRTDLHK